MAAARKRKALGWGVVTLLLLAGAGFSLTRPAPALVPLAELEARSATDAKTLAPSIPGKYADKTLSLLGVGDLPVALTQVANEVGVSVVRLWSPSGVLLAASDTADATVATAADRAVISAAHGPNAHASTLADQPGLLRIFEPVQPDKSNAVVAEVVRATSETGLPFKAIAAGLAASGVIALIAALASLLGGRRGGDTAKAPAATAAASVPAAAMDLSDDPRDPAVERDTQRLAQKLKTSEASRAAMEIQMEQLRAQLRMGTQGSEQIVAGLDSSLASSQLRAHEAGEKLALAETRAREAERRATIAEEALSRAAPSEATDRLTGLEGELAVARNTIAELEGVVSEHQAGTRDAEARAAEADKRATAVDAAASERVGRLADAEARQRESEERSLAAEARATHAETVLTEVQGRAADLRARLTASEAAGSAADAQGPVAQLKVEPARSQDMAEQVVGKLEVSKSRRATAETLAAQAQARLADAGSRTRDAEGRAAVAGAPMGKRAPETDQVRRTPDTPPGDLSLAESSGPITAPADVAAPTVPDALSDITQGPAVEAKPEMPAPEAPSAAEPAGLSATDPGAWEALAKSLRRDALGDEAGDEPEEEETTEEPAVPMTEEDRSQLRARLARASAKKRRKIE